MMSNNLRIPFFICLYNLTFHITLRFYRTNVVWILPVYQHMFIAKKSLESFEHRLAMCQLCFGPITSRTCVVKVLPIEKEAYEEAVSLRNMLDGSTKNSSKQSTDHANRLGTIDIIRFIKNINSTSRKATAAGIAGETLMEGVESDIDLDLHLVLGSDTFMDLMMGKWRESER